MNEQQKRRRDARQQVKQLVGTIGSVAILNLLAETFEENAKRGGEYVKEYTRQAELFKATALGTAAITGISIPTAMRDI